MTYKLTAVPAFRLPEDYRHMGEPSAWAKMNRPGIAVGGNFDGAVNKFIDAFAIGYGGAIFR